MSARIVFSIVALLSALCFSGGCTARPEDKLIQAAAAGNVQDIHRLLSLGISVNCVSRDPDKFTPLLWAVAQRREKAVMALLAAGADPNLRDAQGKTALFYAFSNQEDLSGIIKPLVLAGANTVEYKSMFATLPENDPNRIAFEQASKERMTSKEGNKP
jgi:hypothetical protein